ncbi:MAG: hypothetical protein IPO24_08365 [Bacteroidetes bacterium]|nr:hypothetical protein [Bacteroidota bacterium]
MFYLIGVVIAFFLVAILLTKRQKTQADWILMGWLSAGGIHLTAYFFIYSKPTPSVSGNFTYFNAVAFVSGPLFIFIYKSTYQ